MQNSAAKTTVKPSPPASLSDALRVLAEYFRCELTPELARLYAVVLKRKTAGLKVDWDATVARVAEEVNDVQWGALPKVAQISDRLVLVAAGKPQDDCPDCQGTGWRPVDGGVARCRCSHRAASEPQHKTVAQLTPARPLLRPEAQRLLEQAGNLSPES